MKEDLKQQNSQKDNEASEGARDSGDTLKKSTQNEKAEEKSNLINEEEKEKVDPNLKNSEKEKVEQENMAHDSQKSTANSDPKENGGEIEIEEVNSQGENAQIDIDVQEKPGNSSIADELAKARKAAADSKDQLLRLQAEFRNFRVRKQKEAEESIRLANVSFLKSILPIFDNIDRSSKAINSTEKIEEIKEGIKIIETFTDKHFKKLNISRIECVGKPFDANLHEAISTVPVDDPKKKGIVIDEVERGYLLKDKVIRFSKVIVGE